MLRKISSLKAWSGIATGCQGSGGVTVLGNVQEAWGHGAYRHDLLMDLAVLG